MKFSVACMKQNFLISPRGGAILVVKNWSKIVIISILLPLDVKWRHQLAKLFFLFHTSNPKFPSLSYAKQVFWISLISYEWYVKEVFS